MEASQKKSGSTIQFLIGSLVNHFAGIFHVSCSVQKFFKTFMLLQQLRQKQQLRYFFKFWEQNDPSYFVANLDTPKRHCLENVCVHWGIMAQVAFPVEVFGVWKNNKKRLTPRVTVYFTHMGSRPH
jgi:hypothetical protein